jgi:hypothetical protein
MTQYPLSQSDGHQLHVAGTTLPRPLDVLPWSPVARPPAATSRVTEGLVTPNTLEENLFYDQIGLMHQIGVG